MGWLYDRLLRGRDAKVPVDRDDDGNQAVPVCARGRTADGRLVEIRVTEDGELGVSVEVGDVITVIQPTAGDLNATVVGTGGADLASEATAAAMLDALEPKATTVSVDAVTTALGSKATTVSVEAVAALLQQICDAIVAHGEDVPTVTLSTGAETVDPAAWPEPGAVGKLLRLIADLRGMLVTTQGTQLSGENGQTGANGRIWTQRPGQYGTLRTGTETLYATPCQLLRLIITTTTAGTAPSVIRDGGAGGTTVYPVFSNVLGTQIIDVDATHGTNVHFTAGATWAGSIQAVVDPAV